MANHVRYVRRRENGVYYYERRVPQAVIARPADWARVFGGQRLFRRSLLTKRQAEAMRPAEDAHREFDMLVTAALGRSVPATPNSGNTRPLSPTILLRVRATVGERVARPWAQQIVRTELGEADRDELERMIAAREQEADDLRRVLLDLEHSRDRRMPNVADEVARIVAEERLDVEPDTPGWAALSRAVREGHVSGQREIDAMLDGSAPAMPIERLKGREASAPRLSEVMAEYIARTRGPRTVVEARAALAAFVAAMGDLRLDEITRAEIVRFCQIAGAKVVGGKTPNSVSRPTSPETLKKKVGLIRAAINHAIETDRFAGANPCVRIDAKRFTQPVPKAIMPDKRPFTVHELQLLVQHPWFTGCASTTNTHKSGPLRLDGMHYWVPILAMHTGCRAGELGGLRLAEVRLDHRHPHIVIQDNVYRTTKGAYGRSVPVLDVLMNLGFGDYVNRIAKGGHDRLFPDWKAPAGRVEAGSTAWANAKLIRSFNRTVVPQQLKDILTEGARQEVTFHGFRGAFKTLLGRHEYGLPDNFKHEVIGHSKSGLDKRYIGVIPLEDTYPAMRRCAYAGLVLPPAP